MIRNYTNPFDRYSSRTKRLNYYLPFLGFGKCMKNRGDNEAFIGREDILYRLRNWITNKDKTGSFLVAGYRGMGKTSFVEKALYNITRQRRRSSKIEFVFLLLHLLTIAFVYFKLLKASDTLLFNLAIYAMFCMLVIFLYVKKYHINYWGRYLLFTVGLIHHTVSKGKWRTEKSGYNPLSYWKCFSECRERLKQLNKEERSRLDKIIFTDYREKTAQRIHIQINLGHEVLKERDILCLIARRIKSEIEGFISNKHLYFWPAYLYIFLSCMITFCVMEQFKICETIKSILQEDAGKIESVSNIRFNGILNENTPIIHTEKNSDAVFFQKIYTYIYEKISTINTHKDYQKKLYSNLFILIIFLLVYFLIRQMISLTFRFIPGMQQYVWIRKQLNQLNDRIHTVIDEETPPIAESTQGMINISFGRRRKKTSPLAGVREIESELIDILSHFDRIPNLYTLQFVIVFDELDKIDPDMTNKEPEDELFTTFEGTSNSFTGNSGSRKRKDNVLKLLANMKHFISTARAKFIFISGRELYDAYLAGLSDREFAISSVFCGAIYVDSFLTSNRTQMSVISMTEQYLCKMLLPTNYLKKIMVEKYYKYGTTAPEYPSLKWYYRYLCKTESKGNLNTADEWRLKGGIIFLHYFAIYLTHISNGSPQKILSYFRLYVRTQDNLYRKGNNSPFIYGWKHAKKKKNPKENYILTFNYVNQRKIAFVFYMAYPIMQAIVNNATQHGDKILISASFLMNHIYKYHSYSFSWRNLEQAPELLEIYRTPELRTFIHTILSYMVHTHMTNIPSGLYNFKFRKSVSSEIAIFSKYSEEIAAIFNFTLDESLSVKKHFTRMLAHYSNMLSRTSASQEHYAMLLSRIHQVLGDLQMTDENYLDSALEYRNSIAYLKEMLYQKEAAKQTASGDIILPIIRNMLKLGLTYERRKTNNSAYVIYYELVCMLIDFRYVDETKLGLELKVVKSQDWRDKKYVLYKPKKELREERMNLEYILTRQDEIIAKKNFEKEIETQLLQKEEENCGQDDYEVQGDELVTGLSKILTPEKSNLIFRLSLLEDLRLVYQAILAKLFVLEKVELGGITKANVDVAESEFRYLYRVTNAKDKFIILVDFFRRLAEILYYKNSLINRNSEKFVTGLYFWGFEFDTDIEEFCRLENLDIAIQNEIKEIINNIDWNILGKDASGWKNIDYDKQWGRITNKLKIFLQHKSYEGVTTKGIEATISFLNKWDPDKSYVKNLSYFKVDECNKHRKEMLENGYSIPCFACRYYNRSMHILMEYFFGEKLNLEDKVSKVRTFLNKATWSSVPYSLRSNYLQTIAIVLDGMGNVQLSCAGKDSELTENFLKQLAVLSDDNKEFEKMEELTSLEKAILYYWAASRYYKKGSFLKDASISMKKILHLLKRYIMVEEALPDFSENRIQKLTTYICPIIDIVARKSILYLYAHNENISIAEIQDLKGLFSLKPYEDISLEKLSLYPDIEEIVMLSTELKLYCYKHFQYKWELMPEEFLKDTNLNALKLYSLRISSSFNIERSVQQLIIESRMKAIWNYLFLDFLFDDISLMEYNIQNGKKTIRYRTDAPIVFYKKLTDFLHKPLEKTKLKVFGMNPEECGIYEEYLTMKEKLQLIEFLLKDSMFCLQRILAVLTTNTNQLLHTNSYIAEIYRMMFAWTQLFKFMYFAYEYMDAENEVKEKILTSLNAFITSRHKSMENELTPTEIEINRFNIRRILEQCIKEISKEIVFPDNSNMGTEFYNHILSVIEPTNLRYIISNYPAEMALLYYNKAIEMHTEGNAYKEMISGLYYLDDDLQNDTEQFHMALERYMINCGYIKCMEKSLKNIYSKAYIYDIECYEGGNVGLEKKGIQNIDPIWGMNV